MRGTRILFFIIIMFYSFLSIGQNITSTENFIAYKFPQQTDSLLVLKLDTFNQVLIQNAFILIDIREKYFITSKRLDFDSIMTQEFINNEKRLYYDCSIHLRYSDFLKSDTTYYGYFLVRNTNYYYVSLNRKYKIPIIFFDDEIFKFDRKKYLPPIYIGIDVINIYLMGDKIISCN